MGRDELEQEAWKPAATVQATLLLALGALGGYLLA